MLFDIHSDTDDGAGGTTIEVTGEIDITGADDLNAAVLLALMGGERHLTFDITGVTFIDSVGLGVMASSHDYVSSRGGTLTIRASARIARFFRLTGLDRVLDLQIVPDEASQAG